MKKIAYLRATGIFDDSRSTKEIMALAEAGHEIFVLSWDRYGNAEEKNNLVFAKFKNIHFYYFPVLIPNGIGLKNILKLFKWFKWLRKTLNELEDIDVVHSCNLDTGIVALSYCQKNKCKLVYDIFDYYIDSHNIPSILSRLIEKKEINVINYASTTIICTEERREQIAKAKPKAVCVIYNSPDLSNIDLNSLVEYDYVYCGALSSMRLIGEILEEYPNHSHLKFFFAGYGEYADRCKQLASKYKNFTYSEPIPYQKVLEIELKAKCLSAIYEPSIRNHRLCAPNKFYESLGLGKPVIVCRGTGIDKVVSSLKCGQVIDYDSKAFYCAIETILHQEETTNAMLFFEKNYDWKLMKKKICKIYDFKG